MPIRSYHDLEVYQEGFDLALRVHRETEGFPVEERYASQSQIRRSSKSVCAVIAEGFGRIDSEAEFRRYLRVAHGSVQETKVWLEFAMALGFMDQRVCKELTEGYERLGKRIYRMIENWKRFD
jgi:four helix bundle protein